MFPSPDPMNTRPPSSAADDLTGLPVLKLQSSSGFAGKLPPATPSSAGPPRNIGQLSARAIPPDSRSITRLKLAAFISSLTHLLLNLPAAPWQIKYLHV